MSDARDRWFAAAALVLLVGLAAAIALLVQDAQRSAIETREEFRLEQVGQMADSMDTRVQQAYSSLSGTVGTPGRWNLEPGDAADAAMLAPTSPQATSGLLLVDRDGVLVNGSLLRDPDAIGQRYVREGIEQALAGEPTLLGIGPGLTTTEPVLGIAIPLRADNGTLAGAYVIESEITPGSAFNDEVAELRAGDTGNFHYIDSAGNVAASSDPTILGQPIELAEEALGGGFHRMDGFVTATAQVPSARWRLVFQQSADEFESDLTGPLRTALVLVLVVAVVGGGTSVLALLRRLRAAREEQRRLAEISAAREEFTSIVSHELRTPVAGLLGFLQTTLDHWEVMSDDERRRAVTRAQANAERLQHLTTEVLETNDVEAGETRFRAETADLRELVTETVEVVRDANPQRTIAVEAPDQPVLVAADPPRLRQVVTNLLDNAIKSSPPEGAITVRINGGDSATVSVRDLGTGIPEAERERVFQKFTRGRTGSTRGSGLGLYLAQEIVLAHGGRIWVGETDGPGATVLFSLPTLRDRDQA